MVRDQYGDNSLRSPVDTPIQTKLKIGHSEDKYEKEADEVADQVMMMPVQSPELMAPNPDASTWAVQPAIENAELHMKCEECEKEEGLQMKAFPDALMLMGAAGEDEDDTIQAALTKNVLMCVSDECESSMQMKPSGHLMRLDEEVDTIQPKPFIQRQNGDNYVSSDISNQIYNSRGGRPLDQGINTEMSTKIGADFSNVRIHTDSSAVRMSTAIGAQAFTHGSDIYFNEGKYDPASSSGKHLLAHELTHTVQQGAAVQTKPELSKTPPKVQPLLGAVREQLNTYARFIPGWTLFTVIIGYNPLLGQEVERSGENLVGGLLELIPVYGVIMMNKLREHNILADAFTWVRERLSSLDLSLNRIERVLDSTYNQIDFIGNPFTLDDRISQALRSNFAPLLADVMIFVEEVGQQILQMIKDALIAALKAVAEAFPGYPLFTKILGMDPLTGEEVISTTAEKIEDFLVLIGKERELEKMRQEGTIQETADWLDVELAQLDFSWEEIKGLFETAWDTFSMTDLQDPIGAFNRTVAIFQPFVTRVLTFAMNVAAQVLHFIKDALLRQLSDFAREQHGYHLLTVILGIDPFTQEVVERNVENIIRGFMSLMEGGEQQFQQMKETGAIEQTKEQVNAAVDELGFNLKYIIGLYMGLWNSFTIDDIFDPIGAFSRIVDTLGQPLLKLVVFVARIVMIVIEVLLTVMNFPFETINSIIGNAVQAFEDIKRDPIGFLKNLLSALKQGFVQFFANIGKHLLSGVSDWLFGQMADANITPPQDLSFQSIFGMVLEILGITKQKIFDKLKAKVGPEKWARIEKAIDTMTGVWEFVSDVFTRGPIAIWEKIQEKLSNLWDMVISAARGWIVTRIITNVTVKLLSMLDPTGIMAVVNSFIAFFKAVQSAIEYIIPILEMINKFASGVAQIAKGNIQSAADFLESTMSKAMPIMIGFLANQVGLGKIGNKIKEVIESIQQKVDEGIQWLIDRAWELGKNLLEMGKAAYAKGKETLLGWLGLKKEFAFSSGEQHSLYFEMKGEKAQLMLASTNPKSFKEKVEEEIESNNWTFKEGKSKADLIPIFTTQSALDKRGFEKSDIDSEKSDGEIQVERDLALIAAALREVLNTGDQEVPLTKVTYQKDDNRAFKVLAEPLTKLPGNTQGSPANQMSGPAPLGWTDVAQVINQTSYKTEEQHGTPKAGSSVIINEEGYWMDKNGNHVLSIGWVKAHLLNDGLHGPAVNWNLVPARQELNRSMQKVEGVAKGKVAEGANLSYAVEVEYYTGDTLEDEDGNIIPGVKEKWFPKNVDIEIKQKKPGETDYTRIENHPPRGADSGPPKMGQDNDPALIFERVKARAENFITINPDATRSQLYDGINLGRFILTSEQKEEILIMAKGKGYDLDRSQKILELLVPKLESEKMSGIEIVQYLTNYEEDGEPYFIDLPEIRNIIASVRSHISEEGKQLSHTDGKYSIQERDDDSEISELIDSLKKIGKRKFPWSTSFSTSKLATDLNSVGISIKRNTLSRWLSGTVPVDQKYHEPLRRYIRNNSTANDTTNADDVEELETEEDHTEQEEEDAENNT